MTHKTHILLRLNLSTHTVTSEEIPDRIVRDYIGGRGMGIRYLWDEVGSHVSPLEESNKLFISAGPFTGTGFPTSSRTIVTTKSPLTKIYLYTMAGSDMGRQLKKAGYDLLCIEGKAERATVIVIEDGKVRFEDGDYCWGTSTFETFSAIDNRLGSGFVVMAIGRAGENRVRYASILDSNSRSFGRGGAGAVMGSKRVKAIAVRGTRKIVPADPGAFKACIDDARQRLADKPGPREHFKLYGTGDGPAMMSAAGIFPTRNWQQSTCDGVEHISMPLMRERGMVTKDVGCFTCPIRCTKRMTVREGPYSGFESDGPEYETICALGSNLGITNADYLVAADALCDRLGLDTISTGMTIGLAMECIDREIWPTEYENNRNIAFGREEGILELLGDIASRGTPMGDLLSRGSKTVAETVGNGAEDFAMHVKGLELGAYDPRGSKGQAIVYAAGSRGGCHHSLGTLSRREVFDGTRFETSGKGRDLQDSARKRIIQDSLPTCGFAFVRTFDWDLYARTLTAVSGSDYSASSLLTAADRINSLERLYNIREGMTGKDDRLPHRLLHDPVPSGPAKGHVVTAGDLQTMLRDYYEAMGWDREDGVPTEACMKRLKISVANNR